jgi:hypothetical protein
MHNLLIELAWGRTKRRCGLFHGADAIEQATSFLEPLIDPELAKSVIQNLTEQQSDPNKFPNAIILMDNDGHPISMDEFVNGVKKQ